MILIKKYILFLISPILRIFSLMRLIGNVVSILKDLVIFTNQSLIERKKHFPPSTLIGNLKQAHKGKGFNSLDILSALFFLSFAIALFFDLPFFVYWNTFITGFAFLIGSIAMKIENQNKKTLAADDDPIEPTKSEAGKNETTNKT